MEKNTSGITKEKKRNTIIGALTMGVVAALLAAFWIFKPAPANAEEVSPPSAPAPMSVTEVAKELPPGTAVFQTTSKDGERSCDIYVDNPNVGIIEQVKQTAEEAACKVKSFLFNSDVEEQAETTDGSKDEGASVDTEQQQVTG